MGFPMWGGGHGETHEEGGGVNVHLATHESRYVEVTIGERLSGPSALKKPTYPYFSLEELSLHGRKAGEKNLSPSGGLGALHGDNPGLRGRVVGSERKKESSALGYGGSADPMS